MSLGLGLHSLASTYTIATFEVNSWTLVIFGIIVFLVVLNNTASGPNVCLILREGQTLIHRSIVEPYSSVWTSGTVDIISRMLLVLEGYFSRNSGSN